MKSLLLCILCLCSNLTMAQTSINARYSPSANLFTIMDQVSNWWPGFTEEEYQSYWKTKFGLNEVDLKLFKSYEELRWRYYDNQDQKEKDPLKNRNGLFSLLSSDIGDPLAKAFYSSDNLEQALSKAEKFLSADDFKFLRNFYKHFELKYSELMKDSESFKDTVKKLNKGIHKQGIAKFYDQVRHFYNVTDKVNYQVLYVWWPPQKRTLATPSGQYLLMYYNPIEHKGLIDEDVIFHEIVHTISAKQSLEQKQRLTKSFLEKCSVATKLKKTTILEEPLAVTIGQILFMEKFYPKKLKYDESLYNNPWISTFGRLITPVVRTSLAEKKIIDENIISSFAQICSELVATAKILEDK